MVKPFYKPLDRPENEEIWYCYYVPSRRRKQQDSKAARRIPISQVPDLTKEAPKESTNLKEKKYVRHILETDSKYLKLAKTGGRRNLLCYRENEGKNTAPKEYKVPEWYYHDDGKGKEVKELSEEEKHKRYKVTYGKRSYKTSDKSKVYERPDYMTHLEPEELRISLGESERIPDRPIFGYDSFTIWKRNELEKSGKLPSLVEKIEIKERPVTCAFAKREVQVKKKKKKVRLPATQSKTSEMSGHRKLASSGYVTQWHEKWYVEAVRKA
ncbi:uncharacterized protein C7orf57 homolog [Oculina patagonica]